MEDLELVLQPMVEDAKEAIVSMGDDTPLAMLSDQYRGLHHFFRQNFSQVTNPPIDSLREQRVMSLKTRLGNLGNVMDEDEGQCRLLQLEFAGAADGRVPGDARLYGRQGAARSTAPSTPRRRSCAARRHPDASAARPRMRCAAAPPT